MTRDEFKQAFKEAVTIECDLELARCEEKVTDFSPEFEDRMQRLFRKNRNPLWHLVNTAAKRALLVLVIGIIAVFSLESIPSVRAYTNEFMKKIFPDRIELSNPLGDEVNDGSFFYEISILPEDFQKISTTHTGNAFSTDYSDQNGNILSLQQVPSSGNFIISYDNELGTITNIQLEGKSACFYQYENIMSLSWIEGNTALTLISYGQLTEEEFLKIAASVKKTK